MALQKTITTGTGIVVNDAYHRIREVKIQGVNGLHFKLKSFVNAQEGKPFSVTEYECAYDVSTSNPFTQAYTYLKELSEFADATDV